MTHTLRVADTFVDRLSNHVQSTNFGLDNVPELVKIVINEGYWKERILEQTGQVVRFDRFIDFVEAKPLEGLGCNIYQLIACCVVTDPGAIAAIMDVCKVDPERKKRFLDALDDFVGLVGLIGDKVEDAAYATDTGAVGA